jgi:pyridoxine 5-phosphate synthase
MVLINFRYAKKIKKMTRLSVNINKIALIRNSRGSNLPNLLKVALDCEDFGAQGITVHPRPDQRHIRYDDIPVLRNNIRTEFNIEGNPTPDFIDLVLKNPPHQVTLVPDAPEALTSNQGWDPIKNRQFLKQVIARFKDKGIRVSIFLDPIPEWVEAAAETGTDRIELYTGPYAMDFANGRRHVLQQHAEAARLALANGLGINAGHDLNLLNLQAYQNAIPNLLEVSIGHALVCDALYYGLQNTIRMYLEKLKAKVLE